MRSIGGTGPPYGPGENVFEAARRLRISSSSSGRQDVGFTLIELLVVITLMSALALLSMRAFGAYNRSSGHTGAARETVAVLRNAQVRAVTRATRIECHFIDSPAGSRLETRRTDGTVIRKYELDRNLVYVFSGTHNGQAHGFKHPGVSVLRPDCYFEARGTATGGMVAVERRDAPTKDLYIELEALTARVKYCADPAPPSGCPG